jgi:acetamidase/formamidase
MALHVIEPERRTLHGHFSRDLPPILTIEPGDTVRFHTLNAGWRDAKGNKFEPRYPELDDGHAMCGPIAIHGAEPGMTLAVRIDSVRPGTWGVTYAGGWQHPVNEHFGIVDQEFVLEWKIDPDAGSARNQFGQTIVTRPFMGVMGMPPDQSGVHFTNPPRVTGGNIDCKELVAGSTLYLPIAVGDGLFSVGDGHAAQGDGEVCVTAIECPMERVELTFDLLPDLRLTTPRAHTPAGWITLGFHEDLNEATMIALESIVDLIAEQHAISRQHALAMASLVVDLRITQIANGVLGVHAVLPHGVIA